VIHAPRPFALLGTRRQGPHDRRHTNKANEITPSHAHPKSSEAHRNDLSWRCGRGKKASAIRL
jgi:hypothetical protein